MAKSISYNISTWETNISQRTRGPSADIGQRLIQHVIQFLTHCSPNHIFHLENSWLTIFHSVIWHSMSYGFDMNCSFHHIFLLKQHMIIFFYVVHLFIIKNISAIFMTRNFFYFYLFGFESSSAPDKLF
jgi:hypothetical protein